MKSHHVFFIGLVVSVQTSHMCDRQTDRRMSSLLQAPYQLCGAGLINQWPRSWRFGLQPQHAMSDRCCRLQTVSVGQTGTCLRKTGTNGQSEQDRRPGTTTSGDICSQRRMATCLTAFRLQTSTRRSHHTYCCGPPVRWQHLWTSRMSLLSCKEGRSERHHSVNKHIWCADIPAVKAPSGLLRTDTNDQTASHLHHVYHGRMEMCQCGRTYMKMSSRFVHNFVSYPTYKQIYKLSNRNGIIFRRCPG